MPNEPWEIISMDLITQLPESNGYNAICVIVNRLTKRAHFISINNRFSSKDMVQLLYDKVYPLHGLPLQIILDRGVQYSAELFQEWCKILGIESTMSTAYHPQTDGQCKGTSRVTLSKFWGPDLLMAQWQIVYRVPIVPNFPCLCHAVRCLLLVVLGHSVIIDWLPW